MPGDNLSVVVGAGGTFNSDGGLSKVSKSVIPLGETILCFSEGGRHGTNSENTSIVNAQPDPGADVGRQGRIDAQYDTRAPSGTVSPPEEGNKIWCVGGDSYTTQSNGREGYILLQW
jgi:hypothetical protein